MKRLYDILRGCAKEGVNPQENGVSIAPSFFRKSTPLDSSIQTSSISNNAIRKEKEKMK